MSRFFFFISGMFAGGLIVALLLLFVVTSLASLMVVDNEETSVDVIFAISGENVPRLRKAIELYDKKLAPRLVLVDGKSPAWKRAAKKLCKDCRPLEKVTTILPNSLDTRTDAQLSLAYCLENKLKSAIIVTSPYHTRRTQFVFNDIFQGSGVEPIVLSTGYHGKFKTPDETWWLDRKTLETIWLEFGKILYWELTPYMEYQGEGRPLRAKEMGR